MGEYVPILHYYFDAFWFCIATYAASRGWSGMREFGDDTGSMGLFLAEGSAIRS